MEWLRMLHPNYWFFRQTRNDFARYWGEGQEWNGFFASWFSGAGVIYMLFFMMLVGTPGFDFAWQSFVAIGVIALMISFFLVPIAAAVILMGAIARAEIKNRRESQRRYNDAMLEALRRCQQKKNKN